MSEPSAKRRRTENGSAPITDSRFASIQSDPRYRLPSKKQKVKLDKRFARTFKNEDFVKRAKIDRYGRPIDNDAEEKRLRQNYEFEDESDEPDDDDEVQRELQRVERKHDPLREGKDVSSSEDESSSDEDDSDVEAQLAEEEEEEVERAGKPKEAVPLGEVSSRIAVVNLDWDNIRAEDLMAVFKSFLPATGRLLSVTVYPSEFGKERMEREELEGPPKEIFATATRAPEDDLDGEADSEEEDDEDIKDSILKPDDGSEFDSAALRQYQLERLRYFYAVLTFSSPTTAKAIYDAVDGTEYLSTANFFDLRFIPDEMDFSTDNPRDECTNLSTGYKPNEFVTDALQHSKVKLTWDQDDRGRKEAAARAFKGGQKEIDENDLRAYLGSDSEGSDAEEVDEMDVDSTAAAQKSNGLSKKEAERQKARALLGLASEPKKKSKKDKDEPTGGIQVTFSSGIGNSEGSDKKRSVFENSPEPEETTLQKYVRKEKERKQRRKDKNKAGREDGETNVEGTQDAATQELGFDDPFFADGAQENAKPAKRNKEERLKKRAQREAEEAQAAEERRKLELLMAEEEDNANITAKSGNAVRHFDMNEIERAEKLNDKGAKAAKKLRKSKTRKEKDTAALAAVQEDDFELNTADPRFSKVFESHEFAIDPSKPGLRKTKGTQALLEETRRRKGHGEPGEVVTGQSKNKPVSKNNDSAEMKALVAKIKRKAR